MKDLYPLVASLAVAGIVYVMRERHRKRTRINPARPDLTIAEAWELWHVAPGYEAGEDVLARARESLTEPDGLTGLRQEIVNSVTTALYLETILELGEPERKVLLKGYEEGMEPVLRNVLYVSNVRWRMLREFGRLKYDDAAPEDWFEQYTAVAGP